MNGPVTPGRTTIITPIKRGSAIRGQHELLIGRMDGDYEGAPWSYVSGAEFQARGESGGVMIYSVKTCIEERFAMRFPCLEVAWWLHGIVRGYDERLQVIAVSTIETLPTAEEA